MPDAPESSNQLAKRLRAAREQAGLSQGQTAKLLGLHRPTISEIEAGRRRVTAAELAEFSKLYDVSAMWLMDLSPDTPDPRIELAARELSKLKDTDFDNVLNLLLTLRERDGGKD